MSRSTEDRGKWRYEDGGKPLEAAKNFIQLLKSHDVGARLDEVKNTVTTASWPIWQRVIRAGGVDPHHFSSSRTGRRRSGIRRTEWPS